MARTTEILDAVVARLARAVPAVATEYFPEKPETYRLNHPVGALLLSYAGSVYGKQLDTTAVIQPRVLTLSVTVILRQLNGRAGAVDVLDDARQALLGFKPPDCRRRMWAIGEKFLGETAGLWQYALEMATEAVVVQEDETADSPLLSGVIYKDET